MQTDKNSAPHRYTDRATELLRKVASAGWYDRASLARELIVTETQLDQYLNERARMPSTGSSVSHNSSSRSPTLARYGHRLLGQVRAAIAYADGATVTHLDAPPVPYH